MRHYLFDWGNTLMVDLPDQTGPMCTWSKVEAVPHALAALSRMPKGVMCHLATNARDSEPAEIRQALALVGLDRRIDRIFCYRELGVAKPSRDYFLAIAAALNAEPQQLTMVGDDLETDVLGALRSGLRAIWYNPHRLACPDGIAAIGDLLEVLPIAREA